MTSCEFECICGTCVQIETCKDLSRRDALICPVCGNTNAFDVLEEE